MRIQCQFVDDFLANLEGRKVYQKTVYVDKTRHAYGDDNRKASSWDIIFQASAVVIDGEGGEALIQLGIDCGIDRESDQGSVEGTAEATEMRYMIERFCDDNGLTVRPGILDL